MCLCNKCLFVLVFLGLSHVTIAAEPVVEKLVVGSFSAGLLDNWEAKDFKGETKYSLVDLEGTKVLKAVSANGASGLFNEQRIDLYKTPIMHWRWHIENKLGHLNEQDTSGDDYAARVYVLVSGGAAFWQNKALNYVWSSSSPVGTVWPNAYTFGGANGKMTMISVRDSTHNTGTWYSEQRNILLDLKKHFGEDIRYIDGVALMSDSDDSKGKVTAYYGDIYFSKE